MLDVQPIPDQDEVHRASLTLLKAVTEANNDKERAMLMLAAGKVLGRFTIQGKTPIEGRRDLDSILTFGAKFEESPYDAGLWQYSGNFEDEVIARYPESSWGQDAIVNRIDDGWMTECAPRDEHVISHAIPWLRTHARSEFAARIIYDVAQAYETRWSLSIAPGDNEPLTTPQPAGDDNARLLAIEWYARLLREAPSAVEAADARRRLIRLRLSADTGQRRYDCEYA
jgi:hypothetical protein